MSDGGSGAEAPRRPMKVCDLTQFYSPVSGGVRRYVEQKIAYIRRYRPDCQHILVIPGKETGMTGDETARVYTIASPLVSRTSRYRALLKLHLVEEVLEKETPHIIESGDPYQLAWKAVASGQGLGLPVVGFYHSHFPEAYIRSTAKYFGRIATSIAEDMSQRYVKSLYNRFQRTFVPSPKLAQVLQAWGVDQVENIDLGVDGEIFHPTDQSVEQLRARHQIPEERRVLLYVGRMASEKNVTTLFEAFRKLHSEKAGCYHLIAVGDGTLRGQLLRLQEETGAVTWLQFCSEAEKLADLYRTADVFVHPGIQETFGLVTLESQACGIPVVGIRGSYMDRIIFTNQTHWAAENTPASLAAAIESMWQQDLRKIGLQASAIVRHQYSWKAVFDRLFRIYAEVIATFQR